MVYEKLTLQEFMDKYSTVNACLDAIVKSRWPDGFVCPKCRSTAGNRLDCRRVFQCTNCGAQTSITANTVFHQAKLSLVKWFMAIYLVAANKQGISSVSLAKHIGCSIQSAFYILQKLRNAMMERDVHYVLNGEVMVDEAYLGSQASGSQSQGRSTETKSLVLVAVEKASEDATGCIHIQPMQQASAGCILPIIQEKIHPSATIETDRWPAYNGLTDLGYNHIATKSAGGPEASQQFPQVHRAISNLKSWMLGAFKNFCQRHLGLYAAEFTFKTNRRNRSKNDHRGNSREGTLAERLIAAASLGSWIPWKKFSTLSF